MSECAALHSHRSLRATTLVVTLLTLFVAFGGAARAATYVSLGDSYAAGPLIPNPQPPFGCLRSDHNYPHLAAPRSACRCATRCSGAKTDDMAARSRDPPGPTRRSSTRWTRHRGRHADHRRQRHRLRGDPPELRHRQPVRRALQEQIQLRGQDVLADRIAATAPKVAAVLQGIHARAPAARSTSSTTRRSCPRPATDAGRRSRSASPTCLTCAPAEEAERDARHPGGGTRRPLVDCMGPASAMTPASAPWCAGSSRSCRSTRRPRSIPTGGECGSGQRPGRGDRLAQPAGRYGERTAAPVDRSQGACKGSGRG